jgi:uncharacterized OB-fold protein
MTTQPDRNDPELRSFWEGTDRNELRVQRCSSCDSLQWPPRPACGRCASLETEWVTVPGRGELFSWTVVARTTLPDHVDEVPYAVAVVTLEGLPVRMIGRVDTDDPWNLHVGMPVTAVFRDHPAGVRLAEWRP